MPPKINGSTMADLIKQAVQKEVTHQLNEMQEAVSYTHLTLPTKA